MAGEGENRGSTGPLMISHLLARIVGFTRRVWCCVPGRSVEALRICGTSVYVACFCDGGSFNTGAKTPSPNI